MAEARATANGRDGAKSLPGSPGNPLIKSATARARVPVHKETYETWRKIFVHRVVRRATMIATAIHFGVSEGTVYYACKFFEEQSEPQANFDDAVASLKFTIAEMWEYYDSLGKPQTETTVRKSKLGDTDTDVVETTEKTGIPHGQRIALLDKILKAGKDLAILQGLINLEVDKEGETAMTMTQITDEKNQIEARIMEIKGSSGVNLSDLPAFKA